MKTLILLSLVSTFLISSCTDKKSSQLKEEQKEWNYPDSLDATTAAPSSHIVLFENEKVRILNVLIKAGEKEPMHTHSRESVMIVDHPARIRYYDENNEVVFQSEKENYSYEPREPAWMKIEGLHSVENIDTLDYSATRIELKE